VNFPTNNTDSHDRDAPPKVTAVHGKTVESNSSFEVSAIRLEAPLGLAVTPGPVHQVIERVTKMLPAQNMEFRHLPDGQKTVRFALQPESLGDVSIVLRLRDSGADLAIRPQRREAAQFLENSRDELLQALKLTGVEMRTVEISSLDTTAGQDMKQDRSGANQGGGHTSQFQSPQSGSSFHGGGRENQWRTPETIAARKGNKDETEKPKMGDPAIGRGIVV
jgi:flagellar hook-length control protein FliK